MSYYHYYKPAQPVETDKGIRARSKRGDFVENWWAARWIEALEQLTDAGRLRRGRAYARKGQVLSIEEKKGKIHARVQGSRATPYRISIQMAALTDEQWEAVVDALAERAIFTAQLLAGEMPQAIEEAFQAAGVSLFPGKSSELATDCSCPDWANPCKHVAATHYILGEQFDEDPFLIFRLRGRDQEQIMAALRARRQADAALAEEPEAYVVEEAATPLAETLDHFWQMGRPLDHFPTSIREPVTPLPILRRLGPAAFVDGDLEERLGPAYEAMMRQALAVAFSSGESSSSDGEEGRT